VLRQLVERSLAHTNQLHPPASPDAPPARLRGHRRD
jgi:hypothetical protein